MMHHTAHPELAVQAQAGAGAGAVTAWVEELGSPLPPRAAHAATATAAAATAQVVIGP